MTTTMTIEQMITQMNELKDQIAKLKEVEKAQEKAKKELESKERAKEIAKALSNQTKVQKRNLTEEIRKCMLKGMTVDEMMTKLNVSRKSILDRRWLIEKAAGLR